MKNAMFAKRDNLPVRPDQERKETSRLRKPEKEKKDDLDRPAKINKLDPAPTENQKRKDLDRPVKIGKLDPAPAES